MKFYKESDLVGIGGMKKSAQGLGDGAKGMHPPLLPKRSTRRTASLDHEFLTKWQAKAKAPLGLRQEQDKPTGLLPSLSDSISKEGERESIKTRRAKISSADGKRPTTRGSDESKMITPKRRSSSTNLPVIVLNNDVSVAAGKPNPFNQESNTSTVAGSNPLHSYPMAFRYLRKWASSTCHKNGPKQQNKHAPSTKELANITEELQEQRNKELVLAQAAEFSPEYVQVFREFYKLEDKEI